MVKHLGRFFVLGFDGVDSAPSLKRISKRFGLGGAIFFDRNIISRNQVKKLTHYLQTLDKQQPLILCVDQEGGYFQRFKPPEFTQYPRACDVTREIAQDVGFNLGSELRELGLNVCLAPVLDVHTNPSNPIINVRSFGSDAHQVAEIGGRFIQGLHQAKVWACGKHFPGHGDTHLDSHKTLPEVLHAQKRLLEIEVFPFRQAIQQSGIRFLMSAHVRYPAWDAQYPATFSKAIMTDFLRETLGYQHLVITDDLGMAGSLQMGDLKEVCVAAFAAGCDLLLVCDDHPYHEELVAHFSDAVAASQALRARAEKSLQRIRKSV